MTTGETFYAARLADLQNELLEFLRAFESIQEEIRPGVLSACQARIVSVVRDMFRRFEADFAPMTPPDAMAEVHRGLPISVRELGKAYELFMTQPGPQWTLTYLQSRAAFCRGLYQLYDLRDRLPAAASHFVIAQGDAPAPHPPDGIARGFIRRSRNDERSDYTLYIPEDYSPDRPMPLIVALHGGYGHGYEYVWTWLRSARSRRYAVLAPKSWDNTWDMSLPSEDTQSILRMLDEVTREFSIDPARVYLTGLSNGATFGYIFGLERSHLFRGMAPIAGVLHPAVDSMLRQGRGKDTPMLVVHGVHDFIFPVTFARSACKLLSGIGYNVTYKELPDWGHAYPYSINERIVLPWLESLPPKPPAAV